jgi:hypothetical protein
MANISGDLSVEADELRVNPFRISLPSPDSLGNPATVRPGLTVNVVHSKAKIAPKVEMPFREVVYMSGFEVPQHGSSSQRSSSETETLWKKLKAALPLFNK